jgi:hypothetical protein
MGGYQRQESAIKAIQDSIDFLVKYSIDNRGTREPGILMQRSADTVISEPAISPGLVQATALPSAALMTVTSDASVRVERTAFLAQQDQGTSPFTKITGNEIGLDVPFWFSFIKMAIPFEQGYGRTVATGDVHNDGWPDILFTSELGLLLYRNNQDGNNAIAFELRDKAGNSFGIGSRVIIHYGENGERHQLRELMLSGGKGSFDAPVAHFGLGSHERVSRVEILWSTGERCEIKGDFTVGGRYRITRMSHTAPDSDKVMVSAAGS